MTRPHKPTYTPGMIVRHDTFGRGIVTSVKDREEYQVATVRFEGWGIRRLHSEVAPMVVVPESKDGESHPEGVGLCGVSNKIVPFDDTCDEFSCRLTRRDISAPSDRKTAPPPASRRLLKGFAHDIAYKFARSTQHFAWLALRHRTRRVEIELFSPRIEPGLFDIGRNRVLAKMCRDNLAELLARLVPPATVSKAVLVADFGIDDVREVWGIQSSSIGRSTFTVVLTDDRGKEWVGTVTDEQVLLDD